MNRPSVIPRGMAFVGELHGDTDLVVAGRIDGPIRVGGALVIDETGVVRGHVHARTVTIRGVLKGNAFGDEAVRVDATARLVGELTAPRVKVVPGARFRGQVHMAEVGEPRLASYDPALHTFAGAPAPTWTGQLAPASEHPISPPEAALGTAAVSPARYVPEEPVLRDDVTSTESAFVPVSDLPDPTPREGVSLDALHADEFPPAAGGRVSRDAGQADVPGPLAQGPVRVPAQRLRSAPAHMPRLARMRGRRRD